MKMNHFNGNQWILIDFQCDAMEIMAINEKQWESMKINCIQWQSMEIHWFSLVLYEKQWESWKPIKINGIQWKSMQNLEIHGNQWNTYENQLQPMKINENPMGCLSTSSSSRPVRPSQP